MAQWENTTAIISKRRLEATDIRVVKSGIRQDAGHKKNPDYMVGYPGKFLQQIRFVLHGVHLHHKRTILDNTTENSSPRPKPNPTKQNCLPRSARVLIPAAAAFRTASLSVAKERSGLFHM